MVVQGLETADPRFIADVQRFKSAPKTRAELEENPDDLIEGLVTRPATVLVEGYCSGADTLG